jgi:hypothetical protein
MNKCWGLPMKLWRNMLILLLSAPAIVLAGAQKVDDYHWTGVERVIAIGDLHGDYERYFDVMRSAGLIDKKGRWSGGETHLVQTGDIPDRGPDTRKIIDHLVKLSRQAEKKGGYIHLLIGNHEAMNVVGDLRYVTREEFQAFTGRNSERLQDLQWQRQLDWMKVNVLDFDSMDIEAYRAEWQEKVPLGWVEHRMAWSMTGEYGQYVSGNKVAVMVNDSIFLHGGISRDYCKLSLATMTGHAMEAMENYDPQVTTIIDDPMGPLWYRGYAREPESEVYTQTLDNILERYGAKRIVVGHSPTFGVIWPRFDGRVILNDTGIATYYGAHKGVLEITPDGINAIYGDEKIALPAANDAREGYLRAVIGFDDNNEKMKQRLAGLIAARDGVASADVAAAESSADGQAEPMDSPGICQ